VNIALIVRDIRARVRVKKYMLHTLAVMFAISGGDMLTELKAALGG
jgi:hypothetical protein